MHGAAYLTTVGVAVAELLNLPLGPRVVLIAALLVLFAVMLAVVLRNEHKGGKWGFIVTALAASIAGVGIMAVGASPSSGAVLFFILLMVVGMRLSTGVAVAWVIGATVALFICLLAHGEPNWLPMIVSYGFGFFAFFAFSVAFRHSLQARAESQQLLLELTSTQGRLRDMAISRNASAWRARCTTQWVIG